MLGYVSLVMTAAMLPSLGYALLYNREMLFPFLGTALIGLSFGVYALQKTVSQRRLRLSIRGGAIFWEQPGFIRVFWEHFLIMRPVTFRSSKPCLRALPH